VGVTPTVPIVIPTTPCHSDYPMSFRPPHVIPTTPCHSDRSGGISKRIPDSNSGHSQVDPSAAAQDDKVGVTPHYKTLSPGSCEPGKLYWWILRRCKGLEN
jgi:hypothetical protein